MIFLKSDRLETIYLECMFKKKLQENVLVHIGRMLCRDKIEEFTFKQPDLTEA